MSPRLEQSRLQLRNAWHYKSDDWWDWDAFLDDMGTGELENVEFVEYVLHSTFPDPVRRIENSERGFIMKTGGWGVFQLKAFVHMKDGTKIRLKHELQLEYEPSDGVSK